MAKGQACTVCHIQLRVSYLCGRCNSREYCGIQCQKRDWPTHKTSCKRPNYILKVDLLPRYINNPRITRTISCPAKSTFEDLHYALQIAFGWMCRQVGPRFLVQSHNGILGSRHEDEPEKPLVLVGYGFGTQRGLNFRNSEDCFAEQKGASTELYGILDRRDVRGKTVHYEYDGLNNRNNWQHVIVYQGRAEATEYFEVLEGEGHPCAEDIGGWEEWNDLLAAYDAIQPTKTQEARMHWYEKDCGNNDPCGLRGQRRYFWDKENINSALRELSTANIRSSQQVYFIHLISLHKQPWFDDVYKDMLSALRSRAPIVQTTTVASTLSHRCVRAIIITDAAIVEEEARYAYFTEGIKGYADIGGTVIFAFAFAGIALKRKEVFEEYFAAWGTQWRVGKVVEDGGEADGPEERGSGGYRMLKVMVVADEKRARMQDRGLGRRGENLAVLEGFGRGHVGFIGDMGAEEGSIGLLLGMLRLDCC